jgi:hypothetical protein
LGVAWLRIVSAAIVLAARRRPWRAIGRLDGDTRRLLALMGCVAGLGFAYEADALDPFDPCLHAGPPSREAPIVPDPVLT